MATTQQSLGSTFSRYKSAQKEMASVLGFLEKSNKRFNTDEFLAELLIFDEPVRERPETKQPSQPASLPPNLSWRTLTETLRASQNEQMRLLHDFSRQFHITFQFYQMLWIQRLQDLLGNEPGSFALERGWLGRLESASEVALFTRNANANIPTFIDTRRMFLRRWISRFFREVRQALDWKLSSARSKSIVVNVWPTMIGISRPGLPLEKFLVRYPPNIYLTKQQRRFYLRSFDLDAFRFNNLYPDRCTPGTHGSRANILLTFFAFVFLRWLRARTEDLGGYPSFVPDLKFENSVDFVVKGIRFTFLKTESNEVITNGLRKIFRKMRSLFPTAAWSFGSLSFALDQEGEHHTTTYFVDWRRGRFQFFDSNGNETAYNSVVDKLLPCLVTALRKTEPSKNWLLETPRTMVPLGMQTKGNCGWWIFLFVLLRFFYTDTKLKALWQFMKREREGIIKNRSIGLGFPTKAHGNLYQQQIQVMESVHCAILFLFKKTVRQTNPEIFSTIYEKTNTSGFVSAQNCAADLLRVIQRPNLAREDVLEALQTIFCEFDNLLYWLPWRGMWQRSDLFQESQHGYKKCQPVLASHPNGFSCFLP